MGTRGFQNNNTLSQNIYVYTTGCFQHQVEGALTLTKRKVETSNSPLCPYQEFIVTS
jgi:hypothetical protein